VFKRRAKVVEMGIIACSGIDIIPPEVSVQAIQRARPELPWMDFSLPGLTTCQIRTAKSQFYQTFNVLDNINFR